MIPQRKFGAPPSEFGALRGRIRNSVDTYRSSAKPLWRSTEPLWSAVETPKTSARTQPSWASQSNFGVLRSKFGALRSIAFRILLTTLKCQYAPFYLLLFVPSMRQSSSNGFMMNSKNSSYWIQWTIEFNESTIQLNVMKSSLLMMNSSQWW